MKEETPARLLGLPWHCFCSSYYPTSGYYNCTHKLATLCCNGEILEVVSCIWNYLHIYLAKNHVSTCFSAKTDLQIEMPSV